MRYTAKVLRDALHEKFPQASDEELYKVIIFVHLQLVLFVK